MTKEEAIELLEDLYGAIEDNHGRDYDEAFRMAIEALKAEGAQGVGRYENAIQKLREMPRYFNGIKKKQITKISAEVVPLSVVDKIGEECERLEDKVAELEEQLADTVSREDYHNLLTASEDIDKALREYQAEEERLLAEAVQGEWIEKNSHTYICSNCGFEQPIYGNLYEYNFCPRCMARMKGGENKWQR